MRGYVILQKCNTKSLDTIKKTHKTLSKGVLWDIKMCYNIYNDETTKQFKRGFVL